MTNIKISNAIKKRFCKDFKLPIDVIKDDHFEYFSELYEDQFNIKEKYGFLLEVLKDCKNDDEFFAVSAVLAEKIKLIIKETTAYEKMSNYEIEKSKEKTEVQIPNKNIYINENIGKNLISIDLVKANFNVFMMFGLGDELNVKDYSEFIKKYTNYEYYAESKMFRQVVFGDLNPTKQQKIQRSIMQKMAISFKEQGLEVFSVNSDELIINNKNNIKIEEILSKIEKINDNKLLFRVESFILEKVDDVNDFFIKKVKGEIEDKLEFKNVPSMLFPQVYKKYKGLPINDYDLKFHHNGFLAKFEEVLYPDSAPTKKIKI